MEKVSDKLEQVTQLLADVATLLMSNGSNTRRVSRNVSRIANGLGYDCNIFYSYSAVVLTVSDNKTGEKQTIVKMIPGYGVHFSIVSDISILSWQVVEQKLSVEQIEDEVERIKKIPRYNKYLMYLFVSLAGGALARIFGGTYLEFFIAFLATLIGLFGRNYFQKHQFNSFITWLFAAFISVSVVNIFHLFGISPLNNGLAACVLWLIPGVPLINGFIDLLSGHIVSGLAKLASAAMLIFMIALGFFLSLITFGYGSTL
ncbi:conserved membrane hypothetical protein [uncultured Paludibacter sp.]|nr:conserved membrane hypothetical protein [uncultured Paludibacter sp.]